MAPVVEGHRIAGELAPHNTLKAVQLAGESGLGSVEYDVRKTSDGHLIVTHGPEIITSGFGMPSWADLQKIDIGDGERIPLFADIVDACLQHKLKMNVEIKPGEASIGLETIELLRAKNALPFSRISSFDHEILKVVMKSEPSVPIGALYHATVNEVDKDGVKTWEYAPTPEDFVTKFADHKVPGDSVNLRAEAVLNDPSVVDRAHEHGKEVLVWFPCSTNLGYEDSAKLYKRLVDLGVDTICCNKPDLLQRVITEAGLATGNSGVLKHVNPVKAEDMDKRAAKRARVE